MRDTITKSTKASEITRTWHLVDMKGKVLGRSAVEIALYLMGKRKTYFVRNLDCGDYVIVINAKEVVVTGKKREQKTYFRHSGYPGGFKAETFDKLIKRKPEDIIKYAVRGMLPQNKLRDSMMKRLFVYGNEKHPHGEKIKSQKHVLSKVEGSNLKNQ